MKADCECNYAQAPGLGMLPMKRPRHSSLSAARRRAYPWVLIAASMPRITGEIRNHAWATSIAMLKEFGMPNFCALECR